MAPSLSDLLRSNLLYFDKSCLARASAVVGLDGFIDEIAGVVLTRHPDGRTDFVPTIAAFGQMVTAAAGRSFGREVAIKRVEPGGNAPNLAEGLAAMGIGIDFYGTLGQPLDPVFAPFATLCRSCTTLGPCGRTLALEFGDGKLMLNNTGRLAELTPEVIDGLIDDGDFPRRCAEARLIGLVNWSRYPHMTACWRTLTDRTLATLTHRPWVIVDLADPTGRRPEDVVEMLGVVGDMARTCRVAFGANLNEAGVLLGALGEPAPADDAAGIEHAAATLRRRIGAHLVAVHSQKRAGAAWSDDAGGDAWKEGSVTVEGAYNPAPVRTTGVGDRFNAGLGAALVAGVPPAGAVAMGCAAGAWFVTAGRALGIGDVEGLVEWVEGRERS